jgi:hypothetical protein
MISTKEKKKEAHSFYKDALTLLHESDANFMLGGGFASFHYTGITRDRKDLDVFCKSTEYPKILKFFAEHDYKTELTDVRWLAKIFKDEHYVDIIFDTVNNICRVDESWYQHAEMGEFDGIPVKIIPAEELIWCKLYVQNRERYDGADVNHLILRHGKKLDWNRLLTKIDQHWHLLLSAIINFQFVYPADYRNIIPKWLFEELIKRAQEQYDLPAPMENVCRGPIIDQTQYSIDIKEWNYKVTTIMTV